MPAIILVICNLCPCPKAGFEKQLLEHDFELSLDPSSTSSASKTGCYFIAPVDRHEPVFCARARCKICVAKSLISERSEFNQPTGRTTENHMRGPGNALSQLFETPRQTSQVRLRCYDANTAEHSTELSLALVLQWCQSL
jgi:hypothetical protein